MKYSITKLMTFEAAHKLNLNYDSPCTSIHGHSFKVEVTITCNELDHNEMIVDFTELKKVQKWIDDNWDHTVIISTNDPQIGEISNFCKKHYEFIFSNVTAEKLAEQIAVITKNTINSKMTSRMYQIKVAIWETAKNKATFESEIFN